MPIIKSAKKKMRQDEKRKMRNKKLKKQFKKAMTTAKKVTQAYSAIDKAVKKKLIHKNKAARLKKRAAKRLK